MGHAAIAERQDREERPRSRFSGSGGRPQGRFQRRREPVFTKAEEVDYKDLAKIRLCVDENGKLQPRRRLNHTAKVQRKVSSAVKRARFIGLIPFDSTGRTRKF